MFGALRQFILTMAIALVVATVAPAMAEGPAAILDGNHPDEAADVVGATAASVSQPLAMRLTMSRRYAFWLPLPRNGATKPRPKHP